MNIKTFMAFILGLISSGIIAYAGATFLAKDISYKNTNVEEALNDLYDKSNNSFSTEETVIGTDENGKPIYRVLTSSENIDGGLLIEIPTLTGSSDKISYSSQHSPNYAWHLFDSNSEIEWSASSNGNAWVAYDFVTPFIANEWEFTNLLYNGAPKCNTVKLEASNDNSTWVTLDTRTYGTDFFANEDLNVYKINNTTAYRYYRIYGVFATYWVGFKSFNVRQTNINVINKSKMYVYEYTKENE